MRPTELRYVKLLSDALNRCRKMRLSAADHCCSEQNSDRHDPLLYFHHFFEVKASVPGTSNKLVE